jgi:hypothetical protein
MTKTKKQRMGAHWSDTGYSKLYQLYRRVEDIASSLEKRRQRGWIATKPHVEEQRRAVLLHSDGIPLVSSTCTSMTVTRIKSFSMK